MKKKNLDIDLREMRWRPYCHIQCVYIKQTKFLSLNLLSGSQLSQEIYERTCFLIARWHLMTQICANNWSYRQL